MSITSILNSSQATPSSVPASAITGNSSSASTSGASGQTLTEQDFLTLLITQLQNQDPANPASDTQLAEEMAAFTTANGITSADTLLQQINDGVTSLNSALGNGVSGGVASTGSATVA
ncbi:flagellar hook capping FlgD N-terminal domain-containing protein [Acidithiobacillus caldus]|uniref:flagellar hook capping FlgD N-terminal domain-containing protein n=2 Tax=Acidithiobacillus caldus TaxID=33059 RepID=UPI0009837089|nr:flagellar hook capping FlgD N-terminal domain-containing protein [Acidithiobacillus caldus]